MRFGPRFALLCTLLLAAAAPVVVVGHTAAAPAAVADGSGQTASAPAVAPAVQSENTTVRPDSMTIDVQLLRDGDARWSVTTRFVLRNESDRQAFDRLADSFEAGDADGAAYDVTTLERAAAAGRDATGRAMTIEEPRYEAATTTEGDTTVGRLTLTVRWTNFTETTGERLRVGDAFNSTDGTWLPGLTQDQTLVIRPPQGYAVLSSPPGVGVQNGVLRWDGPTTFDPGYLGQITYEQTRPPSPTSPDTPPTSGGFDLSALGLVGLLVVGLGALAIGAYVVSQRSDDDTPAAGASAPNANGGVDTDDGGTDAAAGGAGAGAAEAADDDEPDFDLLSDEERVEYLLEQNGGRMKQANIVKETGWSNAKVSQLLSAMDEEGRIDKLRIGRENLISLPDEEVGEFDRD